MRLLRIVPFGALAFLLACSAITSFDNFSDRENAAGASTASSSSGTASSTSSGGSSTSSSGSSSTSSSGGGSTSDGGGEAGGGPVVLSNEGFEGATTCAGWRMENGSATIADSGHTGTKSCRVCVTTSFEKPKLTRTFPQPQPGTWKVEAWVIQSATDAGVPTGWKIGFKDVNETSGSVTSSWTTKSASALVAIAGLQGIEAEIELDASTVGRCMLVDDIVVTRTP